MPRRRDIELETLLEGVMTVGERAPALEDKLRIANTIRSRSDDAGKRLDEFLIREVEQLRLGLDEARKNQARMKNLLDKLAAPPWYPAVFQSHEVTARGPAALVCQGTSRRVVSFADDIDIDRLKPGDEVLLGPEQNVVVAISPYPPNRTGEIAEFQRYLPDGRLLLKSRDEEVVVDPAGTLAEVTVDCGQPVRWDKNLGLAFERVERSHGDGLFLEETPTDTFEQIGGLDPQIERVQRAIRLHMDHPEVTRLYNLDPLGAVLLVGPPGTGKTMFARATANWLAEFSPAGRSRFMYLKPSGLHTMWYGETERNYREAFRVAREAAHRRPEVPVVVFIDEVDSVGSARGQSFTRADDRVLMAVMAELDGVERRGNVLVLAATNRADALDPALVRSGRLGDLVLDIPRPAREAARAILDKQLEGTPVASVDDRDPHASRHELIDAVIARIFAPNGSAPLAKLRLRDGQQRDVTARDLVSGAAIANIAREASERACHRDVDSGARGVRLSDVLAAVDEELDKATRLLSPANCSRFLSGLPQDVDVVSVEPVQRHEARTHRFLKLA